MLKSIFISTARFPISAPPKVSILGKPSSGLFQVTENSELALICSVSFTKNFLQTKYSQTDSWPLHICFAKLDFETYLNALKVSVGKKFKAKHGDNFVSFELFSG